MQIARITAIVALAASSLFAQSAFDGTWALNQEKSKLAGETMKIESAGANEINFVDPNFTYSVKTDGTKAQTPSGATIAIQKKDDNTYHSTIWRNNMELQQSDYRITDGGKTLTIDSSGTRPDGEKFHDVTTYARTEGKSGLAGTWKTTSVKQSKPITISMKTMGDQMQWDIPEIKGVWKGSVDGKESAPVGPTVPPELTLSVRKKGDRSLEMTEKLKGKVVFSGTYTVSEDGKTMTVDGKNSKGEPLTEVWEKKGGS